MIIIAGSKKHLTQRYLSNFFDYGIFFGFMVAYIVVAGDVQEGGSHRVTGMKALLIPVAWFLQFPVSECIFGQTIGKKALELHVVDLHGETPTIGQTFCRRMFDLFDLAFIGIPGLLMINHSERNQRLGDMVAGTTVVRTQVRCALCNEQLELTTREALRDEYTCPKCNRQVKREHSSPGQKHDSQPINRQL